MMALLSTIRALRSARALYAWLCRCVSAAVIWLVVACAASADTHTWTDGDAGNSNWSDPDNWSPAMEPATTDNAIIVPVGGGIGPAIINTGTDTVANLTIQKDMVGNLGEVRLFAGTTLAIFGGDLTNDGLIVVNSNAGTTGGRVLFSAFMGDSLLNLTGTGTILLQSGSQFIPSAVTAASIQTSSSVVTQAAGHTIRGVGLVSASMVNNGNILADDNAAAPGSNTLELSGGGITNNGTLAAQPGGTLDIVGTYSISQGAGGVIQAANGGTVLLRNSLFISGGSLETKGTGLINNSTGSTRLTDVVNQGTYRISAPATTFVGGSGLSNNGEIQGLGTLNYLGNGFLDGTGELVLGGTLSGQTGVLVTHGATHKIRGAGSITVEMVNNGVIQATGTLNLLPQPLENNHELRAAAGGTLVVRNQITQDSSTGLILAENGGIVRLAEGSRVIEGTLESQGTGLFRAVDGAKLRDVVSEATIHVQADQVTGLMQVEGGGLTNNGSVVVNPAGHGAPYILQFVGDPQMTLAGTGIVDLNGVNTALNVANTLTLTNDAGHTIEGIGTINGDVINEGAIEGDATFNPIRLTGRLSGTGSLQNVSISGTHAPGNNGPAPANVSGLYEIATGGKFEMEVGGTTFGSDYDYVDVGGPAQLTGTLEVTLVNGYVPQPNTSIPIVIANSGRSGMFTNEILPDLYGGLYYEVEYLPNQAVLSVVGVLGDYNQNGIVDSADYTVWRDTVGTNDMRANGDNTGASANVIDEADFLLWRDNFGLVAPTPGAGSGAASVPEPASWLLTLLASIWLPFLRSLTGSCALRHR